MSAADVPAQSHKTHGGLNYSIIMKPNDSKIYLDIDELGLRDHEVHTQSKPNMWDDLEKEADRAAITIIDLHNAAPKVLI